jgi:predicted lipid-binding transport protein (Tim44 family)
MGKRFLAVAVMLLFSVVLVEGAFARAGGGRSSGSRGTRSMSTPTRPSSPATPSATSPSAAPVAPAQGPTPSAYPPAQPGGFMRGIAGGLAGGFLGSMLFGGMRGGVGDGMGGGGIGFFEILLLGGLGYLGYRYFMKRRQAQAEAYSTPQFASAGPGPYAIPTASTAGDTAASDRRQGIERIRQMDPSFDEKAFAEAATDLFFRVQGAWTRRDMAPVAGLLTDEMRGVMQGDASELKAKGQVNRLENIAVRSVEIAEAWQESGQDYITALFLANLLDYTTDESGKVLSGSDSVPVKFEEFWTVTRPVGPGTWKLSAIQQTG